MGSVRNALINSGSLSRSFDTDNLVVGSNGEEFSTVGEKIRRAEEELKRRQKIAGIIRREEKERTR